MTRPLNALTCAAAAALLGSASIAAAQDTREPVRADGQRDVSAVDVVATPASDLNLRKDEIPALLLAAVERPYERGSLRKCSQIAAAIVALDDILGPDIDLPQAERERLTAGRVAKEAVGAFIPFRGLIREISGANAHERKVAVAVQAGLARRAYLKGYGEARGCNYPARAASAAQISAATPPEPVSKPQRSGKGSTKFVAKPVVQTVD